MRVLAALADDLSIDLGLRDPATVRAELNALGNWTGTRTPAPDVTAPPPPQLDDGRAVLATWRLLLDAGRMQDGEPHLAATARPAIVRLSAATAARIGAAEGEPVTVSTDRGRITLPLTITEMPDDVVWVPMNSVDSRVHATLGATPGDVVEIGAPR